MFECKPDYKLYLIESFYAFLEDPIFKKLYLKHEKIMYATLSATTLTLTPQENVEVMQFIEQEIIKVAKSASYNGILTTNTSRITEVCTRPLSMTFSKFFFYSNLVICTSMNPIQNLQLRTTLRLMAVNRS